MIHFKITISLAKQRASNSLLKKKKEKSCQSFTKRALSFARPWHYLAKGKNKMKKDTLVRKTHKNRCIATTECGQI